MKSAADLKAVLKQIDHKGYPAYKDTRGKYRFEQYILSIDHVQGDPFASPSKISIIVPSVSNGFDRYFYETDIKRIAFEDMLLRKMAAVIREFSFRAKGSGKSGLISISEPGQEVLDRSACIINQDNGELCVKLEVGFPANGRTINAGGLEKILFDFLPVCVRQALLSVSYKREDLEKKVHLAEDQHYIRSQLKERDLAAFIANGSILPRKSGVSDLPMKDAVAFTSPDSMEVAIDLPHKGCIKGMGIRKGITLIVGGGYHGKSTLLKALELGVYDHIEGDGREYVITDDSAMKLRAEDGRSIHKVDISMFIRNLPNGRDTEQFFTEDASGSTSQAAATVEAMEAGSRVLLIDEDTSATNFMIRDELMQRVVNRDEEPIIPFIDRVRELYESYGISTILVAGSSGLYFHKADCVIQMKRYKPTEITSLARKEAENFPIVTEHAERAPRPSFDRRVHKDKAFIKNDRIKIKIMGMEGILINKEMIDLRMVEQFVDSEQLNAVALIIKYMKLHVFDGSKTLGEAVEYICGRIEDKGFEAFCEGQLPGNLVIPRRQEIYAALNRSRGLNLT